MPAFFQDRKGLPKYILSITQNLIVTNWATVTAKQKTPVSAQS